MRPTIFALAAALAAFCAPLYAQEAAVFTQAEIDAAPACGKGRGIEEGTVQLCSCKATTFKRFVWGSGPYSGHSDVCTAARHAGVIDEDGGVLAVMGRAGQTSYTASDANGISSKRWGLYQSSFDVMLAQIAGQTASEPSGGPVLACSGFSADLAPYTCSCPEGSDSGGSVWGSGPYTGDSDVCRAAVHAGAIPAAGGQVRVTAAPGRDAYEGTSQNGVTTSRWGSYGQSFEVAAAAATVTTLQGTCETMPADTDSLVCVCPENAPISKSVWGSGPYTADSDICTAARHAGVVGDEGGSVTAIRLRGLDSYAGSAANGITTSKWGSFEGSITFDRN
ncbi:LCCL domain protein [Sulfitobacter sp. THAF37]|uniref:LCCL domain-containing protein n=1 Tax=Sulfitobacter sp. THAF37 TaxID=2587855 RepID=UPI001268AEB9|nr:LCCL domain-containing protein [Sulfitobacter sp. THAF37]QFT60044.1 LCCL domain protein [Sulfitobacter sp. THAF37]